MNNTAASGRPWRDVMADYDSDSKDKLDALLDHLMSDKFSEIDHGTRELIHIAASTAIRETRSIRTHVRAARDRGVGSREILHAVLLGALSGGVPSLSAGLEVLDDELEAPA
jgi:alkylhydroperoxidase/carboxymuconolactone decarboxylase family protein YurZ